MLRIQCLFYKHEDKGQNSVFWGRVLIYLRWSCPCTYPRGLGMGLLDKLHCCKGNHVAGARIAGEANSLQRTRILLEGTQSKSL